MKTQEGVRPMEAAMSAKRKALTNASFGSRTAEDESDSLQRYFVETEQWRKVLAGDVDIVFGAKGAGKSALYSLLVGQKEQLRLGRRTIFIAAENPRGTPAFRDLTTQPPLAEEHFRRLWKLFFLSLAADYFRHHVTFTRSSNEIANPIFRILEANGLLTPHINLVTRLKAVLVYIRKNLPVLEGKLKDPNSGVELQGKITFQPPSGDEQAAGYRSLDDLLNLLNEAFNTEGITCWLALDRLDVAFSDSAELEGNALRALFRTYLDCLSYTNIKIKIFLRDDIWRKITGPGFREASHVTRTTTLAWDASTLQNLVVRRIIANPLICDHYSVQADEVQSSAMMQGELFYKIFPAQIDVGKRQPKALDWILSRIADGTKRTAPRELIHFLNEMRDEQLKLYQLGHTAPPSEQMFDRAAIRAALPAVSSVRFAQTLCAEHPGLKDYLEKLEGEKTEQNPGSLAKLWKLSADKSIALADRMIEAGFFERRGTKEAPVYWVPFLYRDALRMVQGAAEH